MRNPATGEKLPYPDQCISMFDGKAGEVVEFFVPGIGYKNLATPVDVVLGDVLPSDDEGVTLRDWNEREKALHDLYIACQYGDAESVAKARQRLDSL